MKKFTRTGKKALSLFLSVLMVMTTWVFVAPTKAEAANGSYYYKVTFVCTSSADNIQFKTTLYGKGNNGRSGSEVTVATKDYTTDTEFKKDQTTVLMEGTTDAGVFPTRLHLADNDGASYMLDKKLKGYWHIYVGSSKNDLKDLYLDASLNSYTAEEMEVKSGIGAYWFWHTKNFWIGGSANYFNIDYRVNGGYYPYVASNKSISTQTAVADIGIPPLGDKKDVSISTTKLQYYSTDQYGVRYEPTSYYLDTTKGVSGLSTSGGGNGTAYTITAGNGMTQSDSAIYRNGILMLNWTNSNYSGTEQQHGVSTYNFKVYNSRHKITFDGNNGTLGTQYTYVYKNQTIGADSSTATSNSGSGLTAEKFPTTGIREGYTFNGIWSAASGGTQYNANSKVTSDAKWYAQWLVNKYNAVFKGTKGTYPQAPQEYTIATVPTDFSAKPTAPTSVEDYDEGDYHYKFNENWKDSAGTVYASSSLPIMTTSGATYKAQYNSSFVQADYSGVTAQQTEAARIKSNPNYEAIYTPSSRNNLQAALDAVVTGKGRTQQDVVDGYAQRIKDAIDALEGQKYSVVFMDGRDNSIIKFSYPNVFGDTIQYPANPAMSSDKNYHYTFNRWEGTAQETNLSTVEKNITIVARFDKAAHSFTEEHISSSCVKQGGTKYTCATCGYSYTEYSGSYGDHVWSSDYTVDVEPTCTQPGSKSIHCTKCEATKDSTSIPALGHDYTGITPEEIVAPSCEGIGVKIRECNRCGYNDYVTTEPTGHSMTSEVIAPTCTAKGYTISTCSNCGATAISAFTDPIAHSYVKKDSECVAPSCVGVGYDVSYCSVCGLKKYDIIEAAGHTWSDTPTVDIEPTCTTKGQKSIHCSVCDAINTDAIEEIPANGHTYDSGEVLAAATCTQDGVKAYHCTVPGCGHTKTETIAKLGHSYSSDFTTDIAATCISAGQKSKHCSRCDAKTEVTEIPALGHSLSTTTTTATCTTGSKKVEKCSRCDYEKTTIISEALGHNFVPGTPVPATCKSSGYTPYTCSRNCGVEGYNVISGDADAAAHTWVISSVVSHGKTVVTGKCSVCGATFSKEVASAHDFKTVESQTPATCTKAGSLVLACAESGCSEKLTVELAVNPNAHGSVENTYSKAGCTAAGSVTSKCKDCGKILATTEIPATGHSFTEQTEYVASTCKTQGHITFKCENCSATKTVTLDVNPNAHKFDSSVHYNANCTTPAYDKYTCENGCGESYEKITGTVAAHAWTFSTSQNGTTLTITCKCSNCDAQHTQTVEVAEGHNYNSVTVTKQPTCSAEGEMKIACDKSHKADCTASITVALPVNENAHSVKTVVTPATCTTAGTAYSYCELCDQTVGETVTIAELGHNYVGGTETVKKAATCENDGVKTVKCTRCDDTIEVAIAKTGHSWDGGTAHAADCTHGAYTTYKCANCGETKDVVSKTAEALGHSWGEWVITNPTNDKDGKATRECSVCHETETVEIPAGNHSFDASRYTETPATCTAKGSRTYTCINHEDCGVSITVETDLAQHNYELKYDTEATCTTDGKVTMECSVCHGKKELTIPAFGHTWNDGVVTTEPTHKAAGEKTFTCSTCGTTRTETIEKLPHSFVAGEEVLPTCKDGGKSGYIPYTCDCGESYNEITDKKIEHKWGAYETVQAASADRCGIEKRTCSECGAVDYKITDATGDHTYVDETVKNATCTEEGSFIRRCTNPNHTDEEPQTLPIPALGHDMQAGENVPATCEHEGYTEYTCSRADCSFSYRVVTAVATGHTEGEWETVREATCTVDGLEQQKCTTCKKILAQKSIAATGHKTVTVNIEADCTTPSQSYEYCSVCNAITSEKVTVGPALGHSWGEWVVTRKSTNTEPGLLTRTCSRDASHTETVETPAGGHTFDMNNPTEETPATCTAEGSKVFKCTAHTGEEACGIELTVTTEKVQHEYETTTVPATCTESGSVKITCKNCGEGFDEIELTALGHDFTEIIENVPSTCNSVGHVTKKCSRCDATETTYSSTLAAHTWGDWTTVQEQTDTQPKIEVKKCSVCGVYDYRYTAPTGAHEYDSGVITTEPTCTTEGVKTFTCVGTHCSCTEGNRATYTVSVAPTGHSAKVETKEATCTETGYVKAVCSKCGDTLDEKTLDMKAHVEKVTITEPTCTTPGQKTFTCAVCGETTKAAEEIPAVPHSYVASGKYVDATCTSPKYEKYNCTYCGDEKLVKVGEASGHDTTENYVTVDEATCTKAGYSEWRCHCGALLGAKVIEPANHTWVKVTENLPKECDGAKVEYEKCSVCGAVKANSVEITESGDHEYVVETTKAATCTTDGTLRITCKHCANVNVEVTIPAVGHEFDEGVVEEGDCINEGKVTFTCTREGCGHTLTKITGTKNHNYVESGDPVSATCTSSGYQLYKCEYCSKEFKKILEAPVSHVYEKQSTSTEPNCYQGGHYIFKCKDCDASYEYDVPATGSHEIKGAVIQAQTCTLPEMTKYTCATPGCPYEETEITKVHAGHTWGDWVVKKEADEATGENGEQERKCAVCDATETAPIPASVHNWGTEPVETTEATCTEAATETYRCIGCDVCSDEAGHKTYVKTVGEALGHDVVVDYNAPTCTESGSYKAHCSRCPATFVTETVEAKGHSFNTFVEGSYVPATCQSEGSMTFSCACGEEQTVTIPVNSDAHKMVEDVENSKSKTCTEAGYKAYKCANEGCSHTYMTAVENPSSHSAKDEWTVKSSATCHSDGYAVLECKDCGAVMDTKVLPADETLHTWKTISEKADHTKSGYSYEQCEVCGKTRNFETEPLVKHDYSTLVSEKAATAEEDGYVTYECSCGDRITLVVPRTGHSFVSSVTKEATCTEKGVRTFTCKLHENCTANYSEEIPALGHKAADVELTPATCIAEGEAVVKCETCGEPLSSVTLEKLPHTYEETSRVEPTCNTLGSITYSCTTEGCTASYSVSLNMVPHKYEFKESVAPTCLESGYDIYVCAYDGCENSFNVKTVSANGHKYQLVSETPATCNENGHRYYECKNCTGDEKAKYDYEVPATGLHSYTETVTVEPGCETAGYTYKKCANCDAIDKNSVSAINPLGHDYSENLGNGTFKCSRCEKTVVAQKTITDEDGTVHSFIGTITKQSTCKEKGEIAYTCQNHKNCERNFTEELPLSEHAANAESIVKTEPKCNIDGTLENGSVKIVCAVCGETITELELTASHSYKVTKVEKATCASSGKVTEVCEKCGHEKTTEIAMDPVAHDFKNEPDLVVAATCTTDGYAVYSCRHCDAQKYQKTTDKLNHRNTTATTVQPGCEVDGYERITCDDCGKIVSETAIEKTGHKAVKVTVAATCTKGGSITTKCSVCGEILDVVLTEATGHTWGAWVRTEEGSCLAEGSEYRECSVCHVREERQSGLGEHHYDIIEVVDPTCERDGYTKYTCSVCGHFYIADYVPHTGHTYTSDFKVILEPTCHSTGVKARTCKYCGQIDPDDAHYVEIQELPHNYGDWVFTTDPTCETNGVKVRTCQNPGCAEKDEGHTQTVVVGKLGHNYGEWKVVKESTCVMNGEKQRVCDRCGGIDTAEIAKVGHKRVADPEVPATCTKTGLTGGSHCSVCGTVFVAQKEIPMTDHMDLNGDGKCEGCEKVLEDKNGTDTCWCHRTGIAALFYRFVRILWKLFKINQYCVCGDQHY